MVMRLDPSSLHPVREEGGDAERQQQHRRRRRLEARDPQVDPARRAVDVLAERQHRDDDEHGERVQQPLEAAVELVVEHGHDDRDHEPDRHGDQLLAHVVERRAVDVVARREVDHRDAVHDEPGGRQDQQVVQVPKVRAPVDHQSPRTVPVNSPLSRWKSAS